jgi:cell volume regulation protein A
VNSLELILLAVAAVFLLSVLASKAAVRLGIPALLLFVGIGMAAGSEGPGGVEFDHPRLVQSVGVIALVFLLFAAGFETRWEQIRRTLYSGISLSTLGVALSSAAFGWFAVHGLGFSWPAGLLLGAIVSSTDAAAVFTVLRGRNLSLQEDVRRLAEFESGSNDPMAVLLTLAMLAVMSGGVHQPLSLAMLFLTQVVVGTVLGVGLGRFYVWTVQHIRLEWEGLYPVMSVAFMLLIYSVTTVMRGNGFLAVYLAGFVAGNASLLHHRSLRLFHDGMAWIMQITMFVVLGLQVFPSQLVPVAVAGLMASGFLMFVARPLSVFVATAGARLSWRQKMFLSWAGLRGAVPIILATFPLLHGVPEAHYIFNVVFFITLTSVLVQGTTIATVSHWLRVTVPPGRRRQIPIEVNLSEGMKNELVEVEVTGEAAACGKRLVDLQLPKGTLVVLMGHENDFVVPSGSTQLSPGDLLLVLAPPAAIAEVRRLVSGSGPAGRGPGPDPA